MSKARTETYKRLKGLTGKETQTVLKYNTFCRLCKRQLSKGESAVSLGMLNVKCELFIHTDCALAQFTKIHNKTFREDVKNKPRPRRSRNTPPKPHRGDGKTVCSFCRKFVRENQTFVKVDKKALHNDGVNSCATRYRRVINVTKHSLQS